MCSLGTASAVGLRMTAAPALFSHAPRILLAEDDAELRALLRECLVHDGYDVDDVESGAELARALERAHATGYDLVVTDVRMPGQTGLEAIARSPFRPRSGFLVLTAFPTDDTLIAARLAGAVGVIAKPFDLDDLRLAVRLLLSGGERTH